MVENPQVDISVLPTNDLLIFGDGNVAQSLGAVEGTDPFGREVIDFRIKPSDLLRKRFNIKTTDLDRLGMMMFRALKSEVIHLNKYDPARRVIVYKLNFLHEKTAFSSYAKEQSQECERLRRQLTIREGEVMHLTEMLDLAKSKPFEFVNQSIELQDKFSTIINRGKEQQKKEGEFNG